MQGERGERFFFVFVPRRRRPLSLLSQLVLNDVSPDHPQPLQAVKLLAQLRSGAVTPDAAKGQFAAWLADPASPSAADPTTRCLAASLHLADGDAGAALRAVHGCGHPEARALAVQALLACDRPDLAERGAAALAGADDDGALASLSAAWVGVALGVGEGGALADEGGQLFKLRVRSRDAACVF